MRRPSRALAMRCRGYTLAGICPKNFSVIAGSKNSPITRMMTGETMGRQKCPQEGNRLSRKETRSSCRRWSADGPVQNLVAFPAKRDQVGFGVVTQRAAPSDVVNVQILRASTMLAPPTVAFQDFPTQARI